MPKMNLLDTFRGILRRGSRSVTQRVILITGVGMALSILVDVLIAVRLGTSAGADALIIALTLPRMMEIIVREGAKFSLITTFIEKRSSMSPQENQAFVSGVLNLFLGVGVLLTLTALALTPNVIALIAPGFTPEVRALAVGSFRVVAPMMIFSLGAVVLWVYLNSRKLFTEAALRNGVVPLVVIVIMAIFWRDTNISLWVSIAYTLGFLMLFLLMMATTSSRMGLKHSFKVLPTRNVVKTVLVAMSFPLLGFGVMQGSRMVERMLATLVAVGGVTSYYFAFRLVSGAQSLIGVSVATVGLPSITEHDLRGDQVKFTAALKRRLGYAFLLSAPICAVFIFLHEPVIRLIYGWGAFGPDSIQQTSTILQVLGFGVIFLSLIPVLNAGLYARRLYHWVFWGMLFTGLVDVLLAWWLSREHGLVGIAYAVSITALMTCLLLVSLVRRSGRVSSGVEV